MTKTPRTPRTAAFKKKVALEALREDQTLNQLASQYDIHPIQVGKWKKTLVEGAESLFEGKKGRRQEENIDREALEKKVGQLTMENDFLKKKLGF
jgi:transposase